MKDPGNEVGGKTDFLTTKLDNNLSTSTQQISDIICVINPKSVLDITITFTCARCHCDSIFQYHFPRMSSSGLSANPSYS